MVEPIIFMLVDCSVGFRTGGTCSLQMLAFYRSVPSLPLSPSHSPLTLLPLLILLFPIHCPSSFRECRRRGAAGRLRRRLGSEGAATTPGTAPGPGGCHSRGRPGLSRAPARTPHYSNMPPTGLRDAGGIWSVCGWRESGLGPGGRGKEGFGGGGIQ